MTTYLPALSIATDGAATIPAAARRAHPARWHRRARDGKVTMLGAIESLAGCRERDLLALAAAAEVIEVPAGTVLGRGAELARQWWMPVDGWLLVAGDGNQAVTVPSGWSWAAPTGSLAPETRVSALRGGKVLTATLPRLLGTLDEFPRLATAIRTTLVVPAHV